MSKDINDVIAINLKQFLSKNNLSAYKIGKTLKINQPTLTRFLSRETFDIKFSMLYSISEYYNVPIDYFLGKAESIPMIKNDCILKPVTEWISESFANANDDIKIWFNVEMQRKFPEYEEWLKKRRR